MKKNIHILLFIVITISAQLATAQSWQWAAKTKGISDNYFTVLTLDANGNSFVAGSFRDTVTLGSIKLLSPEQWSIYVAKYDPNGQVLWGRVVIYGDTIPNVFVNGIAVDPEGEISITGRFAGRAFFGATTSANWLVGGPEYDVFVSHLKANGEMQWTKTIAGPGFDYAGGVNADRFGNIYVCGELHEYPYTGSAGKLFLAKYSTSGNLSWFDSTKTVSSFTYTNDMRTDANGNIYIIGSFFGVITFDSVRILDAINRESNTFIAKFSSNGENLWLQKAGGGGGYCGGNGIDVDDSSNCYITGFYRGAISLGSFDLFGTAGMAYETFVAKCDQDGEYVWVNKGIGAVSVVQSRKICADGQGNCTLLGGFTAPISFDAITLQANNISNIFLAKTDAAGKFVSASQCSSPTNVSPSAIRSNNGSTFLAGSFVNELKFGSQVTLSSNPTSYNAFLAKLDQSLDVKQPQENTTVTIFPNPAHASFSLIGDDADHLSEITISDVLGKQRFEIKKTDDQTFDCSLLPNGEYFLSMKSQNKDQVLKLIKQ